MEKRVLSLFGGAIVVVSLLALAWGLPSPWPWLVAGLALSGLAGLGISFSQSMQRLSEMHMIAQEYAKGDLRKRLKADPDGDEIDRLRWELNRVGIGISEILGEIKGSTQVLEDAMGTFQSAQLSVSQNATEVQSRARNVAAAAEQSSAGIAVVSQSAHGMTDSVTGVAAAMEEMGATASEIERMCQEENRVADKADAETSKAMQASKELADLAASIGSITQVIQEIASQTNLLALNATIEAAGAGEAGKGFAVVAGEVKELSRQTAKATGDIREKIQLVQSVVERVADSIQGINQTVQGIKQTSQGTLIAVREQRSAVDEVARNMAMATTNAQSIAMGLQEISLGARTTAEHIADVHGITLSTKNSVDQTSAQAKKIDDTVQRLSRLSASFKATEAKAELTPDLFTGVAAMDNQHRRLFELVNQLSNAVSSGHGNQKLLPVIDGLIEYTGTHFKEEEALLRRAKYKDFDAHVAIHKHFVETVLKARQDFAEGKGMVASELIRFLTQWLVQHIGGTDKKYGKVVSRIA